MNKNIAKRRQQIKQSIWGLEDQREDLENELQELIKKGTRQGKDTILLNISDIELKIAQLRFLKKCLLYPTKITIKNGAKDVEDFAKDNDWFGDATFDEDALHDLMDGYVENYLLDNYGEFFESKWVVKENPKTNTKDIFITRIRWFESQLIKEDLKSIAKGKIDHIENFFVYIGKHPFLKGKLILTFKDSGYPYMASPKQALKELKNRNLI